MIDKNGNPVVVGARVRFAAEANSDFREGWVRAVRNDGMFARVDDGKRHDTFGETFSIAAWVRPDEIEVRREEE